MTTQDTRSKRRAPAGLGTRGKAFWRSITAEYEFSDGETALLEEACRCLDRLDLLTAVVSELGAMVFGSQGQQVINPALTEARGQQAILHRLIAALQMPDADGEAIPTGRTLGATTAANARWKATKRQAG